MPAKSHGHRAGLKRTRANSVWMNMKSRCNNPHHPDYKNYGGRGIFHCEAWNSFAAFLSDMGEPPEGMTLDRRDNSLGYSRENCRWATRAEQNLNKRNIVRFEHNGRSLTLGEWSSETGVGRITILKRIQRGVPISLAITKARYLKMPTNDATNGLIRIG